MPQTPIDIEEIMSDERMAAVLDAVRQQADLPTREQAAEYLLRRRIRKGNASLTGRGRALHQVIPQEGAK